MTYRIAVVCTIASSVVSVRTLLLLRFHEDVLRICRALRQPFIFYVRELFPVSWRDKRRSSRVRKGADRIDLGPLVTSGSSCASWYCYILAYTRRNAFVQVRYSTSLRRRRGPAALLRASHEARDGSRVEVCVQYHEAGSRTVSPQTCTQSRRL